MKNGIYGTGFTGLFFSWTGRRVVLENPTTFYLVIGLGQRRRVVGLDTFCSKKGGTRGLRNGDYGTFFSWRSTSGT